MNTIQNKGATLDVLNLPSMTGIADPNLRQLMTNLIIELYKYQAESERKRIIERQQQGIALAKQQGKYHGRKPQYGKDDPRLQHAFKLYQAGMSDVDVARNTGIKRTTFIRYRKKLILPLRWLAIAYVDFVRGTPLMVQTMFVYFGFGMLVDELSTQVQLFTHEDFWWRLPA